jgi:hypothetical protein
MPSPVFSEIHPKKLVTRAYPEGNIVHDKEEPKEVTPMMVNFPSDSLNIRGPPLSP